jgi:cytochrome c oxidase cbb3-type subunit III
MAKLERAELSGRSGETTSEGYHVYDGIVEHDNPLPRWWLVTFFGAILFAAGYWFHFEGFHTGLSPEEELAETAAADAKKKAASGVALSADALVALSKDKNAVAEGEKVFRANCVVCHGDKAEGKIGPNLTDNAWLHGGAGDKVFATVSKGVPDKGMPAWEPQLGARNVQNLTAYVLSLKGTNVPGKAPQGEEEL